MPAAYDRCVRKVRRKLKGAGNPHAICTASDAGGVKGYRRRKKRRKRRLAGASTRRT